jgi:hypothetical protein
MLVGFLRRKEISFTDYLHDVNDFPRREVAIQKREDVLIVLRELAPYLVLKREQALDAIARIEEIQEPRICTIDGCEESYVARGMCRRHYKAAWYRQEVGNGAQK